MSTEVTATPTTETPAPAEVRDPGELSFADYQTYRRTGEMPKAPAAPSESAEEKPAAQKEAEDSETPASEAEATDETDESEESSPKDGDEPAGDDEPKDKPKKQSGWQRRVNKFNAKITAAQQEAEYWEREALKQGATTPKADEPAKPAAKEGKPNPNDFDSHEAYLDARDDWNRKEWAKDAKAQSEKDRQASERASYQQTHSERVQAFAKKTPDFADVISDLDQVPRNAAVEEIIVTSTDGPELLYELGKNPEEASRICKLPPLAAAAEIGFLRSRLAAKATAPKPELKKLTNAPKPIEPVNGVKTKVAKSIDDPDLSFSDYVKLRREQKRQKRA